MTIDVVIPCFNAENTVERATLSALAQAEVGTVYLVDDGSGDTTWQVISQLAQQHQRVVAERLPNNGGVARARNWGALHSQAQWIAFLDADDEYESGALAAAVFALQHMPYLGLVRLKLRAVGFPEHYVLHPNWAQAWRVLEMTVGGNMVFHRSFFLACGGFPQQDLFRVLGGEDGALGIATVQNSVVGTLFDDAEPAVRHYYHRGMHAERLLNAHLFGQHDARITSEQMAQAQAVTAHIGTQLHRLQAVLNVSTCGTMPLQVERR